MNIFNLTREQIQDIRDEYPKGTRVRLVEIKDPYSKLASGDEGTVTCVDDQGTIHVQWDSGSKLGLIFGVDDFDVIEE